MSLDHNVCEDRVLDGPASWGKRIHWRQCHGFHNVAECLSQGNGTYSSPNGAKYVGEFAGGKKHGKGTYTSAGGRETAGYVR